jgi:hypothetical protein
MADIDISSDEPPSSATTVLDMNWTEWAVILYLIFGFQTAS